MQSIPIFHLVRPLFAFNCAQTFFSSAFFALNVSVRLQAQL